MVKSERQRFPIRKLWSRQAKQIGNWYCHRVACSICISTIKEATANICHILETRIIASAKNIFIFYFSFEYLHWHSCQLNWLCASNFILLRQCDIQSTSISTRDGETLSRKYIAISLHIHTYLHIYFIHFFSIYEFSCYLWKATFFLLSTSSNAACCFSFYWLVKSHDRSMVLHCFLSTSTPHLFFNSTMFFTRNSFGNIQFSLPSPTTSSLCASILQSWFMNARDFICWIAAQIFLFIVCSKFIEIRFDFSFSFVVLIFYNFSSEFSFLPNTWSEQKESKQRTCKSDDFWENASLKTEVIENVEKKSPLYEWKMEICPYYIKDTSNGK